MRSTRTLPRSDGPNGGNGPLPGNAGTLPFLALVVGSLIAVSYPVATLAIAALAVVVRYGAVLLGRLRPAPTDGDPICVPGTTVCLGA